MNIWWTILAGVMIGGASLCGVLMTLITLPGVWLMLAVAVAMQWVFPAAPFSWWTIGVCAGVALAGEVFEFVASPPRQESGRWTSGASARSSGLVGAIAGTFVVPIIGSLVGAVLGAGIGGLIAERAWAGRPRRTPRRSGEAQAAGRLAASLVKAALTAAIGVALTVAAVVA